MSDRRPEPNDWQRRLRDLEATLDQELARDVKDVTTRMGTLEGDVRYLRGWLLGLAAGVTLNIAVNVAQLIAATGSG